MESIKGALAYDPFKAAVSGAATANQGAGGGLISGNGTFFSQPTQIDKKYHVSDVISLTGTIAGSLTIEISNDDEDADRNGTAQWATYGLVNGQGFTNGVATLVAGAISGGTNPEPIELVDVTFGRLRYKLVVTGGTGTIRSRRTVKGV